MEESYVQKPDSHMVLAILTTICCCLPFGIVAVIKASKVNELYLTKQYAAAQNASSEALKWSVIGIVLGVFSGAAYAFINLIDKL